MIGGIFETIGKTLGVGKEKYFLELDDAAEASVKTLKKSATKAAKTAVETAKDASADVVEKAKELTDEVKDGAAQEAAEKAKSNAKAAADKLAAPEEAPKGKAAKAKAAKEKAAKKAVAKTKAAGSLTEGNAPEAAPAPAAEPVMPAGPSEEDLIVAAIAATSSGKTIDSKGNIVEGPTTFSTDYLMTPSRSSRRRPGPSLSAFKGMAKEVNPRLKG